MPTPVRFRSPAAPDVELAGATWPQVEATGARTVLALPLGSLEQHGPASPPRHRHPHRRGPGRGAGGPRAGGHRGARALLRRQRRARGFPRHAPGRPRGAGRPVVELVRSARRSFAGVVAGRRARRERARHWPRSSARAGQRATTCSSGRAAAAGGDAHAGRTETSLLLALDPSAVRLELAEPGCTEPLGTLLPRLRAEGVRPVSSNGVLGDPTGASAEEGLELLDALASDLAAARVVALVTGVSPRRRRHRRGAGHRRGDGRCARGRRLAGGGGGPLRRRPGARLRPGHQGRPGGGGRPPRRRPCAPWSGDVRSPSDMRAAVDEAVGHFGGVARPSPRPASSAAGRRCGRPPTPSGTRSSTSTSTGCATWPRPSCRRCWRPRHRARDGWWRWPRRPGCSGCRGWAPTARRSTP